MSGPSPTGPHSLAIARGRAYDLLGGLFRRGPVRVDHLRQVAALKEFVPYDANDDAFAEHYRVLVQEVPPFESVFLEPLALLGGVCSSEVRTHMARGGFTPDDSDAEPDHIGTELAYLAHLCGAEADAWHDGLEGVARRLQALQREFLALHLMRWLPALVVALGQVDTGLYVHAGRLVLTMAADHLGEGLPEDDLPELEDILSNERTGLRQVGDFIAVPRNLGALPTPQWIRGVGRGAGAASGFGKRGMLFENLLQTAVRQGRLGALMAELDTALEALQDESAALPGGARWARRVGESRQMLARMEAARVAAG